MIRQLGFSPLVMRGVTTVHEPNHETLNLIDRRNTGFWFCLPSGADLESAHHPFFFF